MSINPSDKVVKVGKFRLTTTFARRALGHYSRRIAQGEMPAAIVNDITTNDRFTDAVQAKVKWIAAGEPKNDRDVHSAMKLTAEFFGLPTPIEPRWEKAEKPEQSKQKRPSQQKQDSKPEDKSDDQGDEGDGKGEPDEQDGEAGQGDGEGEDGEETEGDADGRGNGNGDAEDDADEDGEGTGQGKGESAKDSEEQGGGSTVGGDSDMEDIIDDEPRELNLDAQLPSLSNYTPRDVEPPPPSPIPRLSDTYGESALVPNDYRFDYGCENQLIARLRAELMSVSRHRKFRNKDTGYVDLETKLADIATGQNLDRVFYTQTNARRLNTAVQLFLDVSGSMEGDKIKTCCALGYLLANTLEKLRVPVEIIAFTDSALLVKSWHEKVASCPVKRLRTLGGTYLPGAQSSAVKSLMMRREARKIQAVITDGDVGWISVARIEQCAKEWGYSEHQKQECLRDHTLTKLHKQCPGLETYGFGLGVEIEEGIFNRKVDQLQPRNMVERIVETLGHVLVAR